MQIGQGRRLKIANAWRDMKLLFDRKRLKKGKKKKKGKREEDKAERSANFQVRKAANAARRAAEA